MNLLVGQVALNEDGLRASQAKGTDLIVDLNLKEGNWRTQSWGEYQLSRGDQSKEASQIQSLKGDQYDFQSLGVGMQRRVGRCVPSDRSSSMPSLNWEGERKKGLSSSLLFKEARKTLDFGHRLGIEPRGGRNFLLRKFVEMQENELAERINALDDLEEEDDLEDLDDIEKRASLSLEF
ncbi:hypothetical protein RHMOL_Rhmol11G0169800 [Rhododendron molle]|uniref:Uncharacterized protein n=1 Tax=Rhododendron molle TaxID=49168 RepID=A0ACC0LU59_RHOML|nr:hypothetical protein RHMOL_Rhmol11G0169800 [Rhododendron molle]